jgi:putative transcriptional regulator
MENKIREQREALGLTQDDLGQMLDVSRQTIISIEKGRYHPSLILAHKMAKVFRKSIEELFIFNEEE